MTSTFRKFAIAASAAGAVAALGAPAVFAAGPHLSPAKTKVTAHTKSLTFNGTINGLALTVTCTGLVASGTTPASGLTIPLPKPPVFSGCTDNTGNMDTVKTVGKWSITANSTGSRLTLNVPRKGATFKSAFLPSCTIIVAPKTPQKISGAYNNSNTWTLNAAKFAVAGQGCTSGATATATSTLTLTPNVSVVP